MGAGILIFPFILLFLYIIPIGGFFFKRINKAFRIGLLCIPVVVTFVAAILMIKDANKQEWLYKRFPQMNTLTFKDAPHVVRDSILVLQQIMNKLPKRKDHQSISYTLDKYPERYNYFTYNWYDAGSFKRLAEGDNLRHFAFNADTTDWHKYMGTNTMPFIALTPLEAKTFLQLIKYLDRNHLNAATLEDGTIALDYNDSLRISDGLGFRKVTIADSGYYSSEFFDIIDRKEGIYLLRKK
jgi:hypothetical protein